MSLGTTFKDAMGIQEFEDTVVCLEGKRQFIGSLSFWNTLNDWSNVKNYLPGRLEFLIAPPDKGSKKNER